MNRRVCKDVEMSIAWLRAQEGSAGVATVTSYDGETVGHVAARLVRKLDGWRGHLPRVIDPLSESQWRAALERHSQHANAMETWLFGIQG